MRGPGGDHHPLLVLDGVGQGRGHGRAAAFHQLHLVHAVIRHGLLGELHQARARIRITSYNVCYTKLLRLEQLLARISPLFERPNFRLSCDLKADDVCVTARQASPLALIVNELVANACEHAFSGREHGTVFVRLENTHGVKLTIHDDGKGLPEDFDIAHSTSLGLSLVRNLAAQLDADLTT